jgi:hypothetical protein
MNAAANWCYLRRLVILIELLYNLRDTDPSPKSGG